MSGLQVWSGGTGRPEDDGYSIVEVLDSDLVAQLRRLFDSLELDPQHDFVATSNDLDRTDARRVHDRIVELVQPRLDALLPDQEIFLSGFISKGPRRGATSFHQDLSYTNEAQHRSTVLWIPLIDVDAHSGALRVVPGSHRFCEGVRPSGRPGLPTEQLQDELAELSTTVPLRAGTALAYDPALIHGAHPNALEVARPALAVALAPTASTLVHVHVDEDGRSLTAFEVDADYHLGQGLFNRPRNKPITEVWGPEVTAADLRTPVLRALERRRRTTTDDPIEDQPRFGRPEPQTPRDSPTLGSPGMSALSILVVTSAPDVRDSTAELAALVTELRRRPGVKVSVWFLRHGDGSSWRDSRVVDDLRTLPVPAAIDKLRLTPLAGVVRGRVLRRWWAEVDPDVVLLDDALGERLLPEDRSGLVVVHRTNTTPPSDASLETTATVAADVQLVPLDHEPPDVPRGRTVLTTTPRTDLEPARRFADSASRVIVRKRLGLPTDGLLVVGWGEHTWFDGPDMFVRTISSLRERHGTDAHGLWVGGDDAGEVAALIDDEVSRCGLSGHLTHEPRSTIDARLCGDVVFLPYRDEGELEWVQQAAITGCEIVTFPVWHAVVPGLRPVDHLDLEAASEAIMAAAGGDRTARAAAASDALDVAPFVDDLLDAIADARGAR